MIRRSTLVALARGTLALTLSLAGINSVAQRPVQPIARPPRPIGPIGPGRFPLPSDGVIRPQPPGVFVVRAVDDRENIVQLTGAEGRTGSVYVPDDVFDVSELKPGDEIVVDFVVPADGDARLVAAAIWKN